MIPRIDYPNITSEQQLYEFRDASVPDRRRMKYASFLRSLDAEDSRMHKHDGQPYMITPSLYQDLSKLYEILKERGFRNIFFIDRSSLIDEFKLSGQRPNRDLLTKLNSLQDKLCLRWYVYEETTSNPTYKICLNPLYGFVYQKDPRQPKEVDGNIITFTDPHVSFYSCMFRAIESYYLAAYNRMSNIITTPPSK